MVDTSSTFKHFISVSELKALMDQGQPMNILDCTIKGAHFPEGRLPGAQIWDADQCRDRNSKYANMLPEFDAFKAMMEKMHVSSNHMVVTYDTSVGKMMHRAAFVLRYFGHPNVRVLDGGLKAWKRADGPIVQGRDKPAELDGSVYDYSIQKAHLRSFEEIKQNIKDQSEHVLDCRGLKDWEAGHIDKAIHLNVD